MHISTTLAISSDRTGDHFWAIHWTVLDDNIACYLFIPRTARMYQSALTVAYRQLDWRLCSFKNKSDPESDYNSLRLVNSTIPDHDIPNSRSICGSKDIVCSFVLIYFT